MDLAFSQYFSLLQVTLESIGIITQLAITCSRLTIGTLEKGVKYIQSQQ